MKGKSTWWGKLREGRWWGKLKGGGGGPQFT